MIALLAVTGLPLVASVAEGVVNGVKKIATVFSEGKINKILDKIKENIEEEDEEECRYCGELTTVQEFWGHLTEG